MCLSLCFFFLVYQGMGLSEPVPRLETGLHTYLFLGLYWNFFSESRVQALSYLTQFQTRQFWKIRKEWKKLKREPNFSMRERQRIETNMAEEYCWAITGSEAVMLRAIRFQCAVVGISPGLLCLCIYRVFHLRCARIQDFIRATLTNILYQHILSYHPVTSLRAYY